MFLRVCFNKNSNKYYSIYFLRNVGKILQGCFHDLIVILSWKCFLLLPCLLLLQFIIMQRNSFLSQKQNRAFKLHRSLSCIYQMITIKEKVFKKSKMCFPSLSLLGKCELFLGYFFCVTKLISGIYVRTLSHKVPRTRADCILLPSWKVLRAPGQGFCHDFGDEVV